MQLRNRWEEWHDFESFDTHLGPFLSKKLEDVPAIVSTVVELEEERIDLGTWNRGDARPGWRSMCRLGLRPKNLGAVFRDR